MKPAISVGPDDKDWQAESDMRVLVQAYEINKDPKRLAAAKAVAKKKSDEMALIAKK